MNLLFINNQFNLFSKADSGASQRSMLIIRAMAQVGHVDVVSFVDETESNVPNVDVVYSGNINTSHDYEGRLGKFLKLFRWNHPYDIYPVQLEKERVIDDMVAKGNYDFIVVRYVHFACDCGLLKYADRLIIDIDDDPKQVVLMSLARINTLRNRIYNRLYANTIDKVSRIVVKSARGAFYSTPNINYSNACFLPNISAFDEPLPPADFDNLPPTIMMVGYFKYYPNVEGLAHFVKNVFPMIRAAIPNVILNVVGKMTDDNLRLLCLQTQGVQALGFVDNIKKVYRNSHCVIVPLYKGTGTSIKMVEAMSIGRTVVTTACGARGLNNGFVANTDFLLAESDKDFADKVIYALTHKVENVEMANSAVVKMDSYYSEKVFNQIVLSTLKL